MKTVMEQLMEIQDKLDALKAQSSEFTPCCDDGCTCKNEMPSEFDSAGFSIEDREPEPKIEFTREQLLTFTTKLAERVIDKCKEAVTDTNLDTDNVVDLSMGYGYQIDIELDTDAITRSIHDEIDGTIELDVDSVEDEVRDIMSDMDMDYKS
jgi:hypothetical protein